MMYLMERASAAAWALAVRESRRIVHGPVARLRLVPLRRAAARAQREFDAYLDGMQAGAAPGRPRPVWARVPVAVPAAAMIVVVAVWAAATAFVPRPQVLPTARLLDPAPIFLPPVPEEIEPPPESAGPPADLEVPRPPSLPEPVTAPAPVAVPPAAPAPKARPAPRRDLAGRPRLPAAPSPSLADITRGSLEVPEVAFTFDAHSEGGGAGEILEALRARGVRATMFLTGGYIRRYPDLVLRLVADGHEVGNHMSTHPRLTSYARDGRQATLPHVTREFVHRQLREADEAFRQVTGRPMAPLWRAPYGEHNGEIRAWAAEAGYRHVGWTRDAASREDLDSRDWVADPSSKIYRSAREIRDRILGFGRSNGHGLNGGIVLMHLGTQRRRDQAHTRLTEILDGLAARGYRLVTVSELLRAAPAPPDLARASTR
jgi:peptidoglycan/xylan/chitin deacetylase (PgdA/CDA1 family)